MKEFAYVNRDRFDEVYAWSYTDFMNMELEDFIPRQHIYRRFNERQMAKLVREQQRDWRAYKLATKKGLPGVKGKEVCFFLDDCAFDGSIWKADIINEIFYNGRHSKITFVFVTQDAGDLPKHLRGCVDVVFAARELSKMNQKTLYENYFGVFDMPRDFRRTFKSLTEDYAMLVLVKNLVRSNAIEDLVHWYSANLNIPNFKMGSAEAWAIAEAHVDAPDPEEQQRLDEELVKQKVAEVLAAKQPLHQIVRCDSRGRPIDPNKPRHKTHRSRHGRSSQMRAHSIPAGLARFDQIHSTAGAYSQNLNGY